MRITPRPGRQGIALIIVMIAIFVLSVLIGAFAYSMKVETMLAMNANREPESVWSEGRSGVNWAMCILAEQMKCRYDSLDQKWAGGPGGECDTNGLLAEIDLNNLPIDLEGNKTVAIKIVDLDRKINLNAAFNRPEGSALINQALNLVGVDVGESPAITSAIGDWIDANDVLGPNGAESPDYEKLDPPYSAKNKPIDDLSELLLVKGITSEMYSSEYAQTMVQRRDRYGRIVDAPAYPIHLNEIFTCLSVNGGVNINTAPPSVLTVLLDGDDAAAERVISMRTETPAGSPACPSAGDLLVNAGFGRPQAQQLQARFVTKSSVFEVEVTLKQSPRKFIALIGCGRTAADIKILSFYWRDQ